MDSLSQDIEVIDFFLVCEKIVKEYFLATDSVTTSFLLYRRNSSHEKVINDCFECYSKYFSQIKNRAECEKKLINQLILIGRIKFSTMFWTVSSSPDQNIKSELLSTFFQVVWKQASLNPDTKEHLALLCPSLMDGEFEAARGIVTRVVKVLPNIKDDLFGIVRGEDAGELPPWMKHSEKYLNSSEEFRKKFDSFEGNLKEVSKK